MDLYSRKIISWTLGKTLEAKWVLEAVEKAKKEQRVAQPLVIHSHCGYRSPSEYEKQYLARIEAKMKETG